MTSPTCQGYSLTSVSWPPTILVTLLGMPQLQEELVFRGGAKVVVVVAGAVMLVTLHTARNPE